MSKMNLGGNDMYVHPDVYNNQANYMLLGIQST